MQDDDSQMFMQKSFQKKNLGSLKYLSIFEAHLLPPFFLLFSFLVRMNSAFSLVNKNHTTKSSCTIFFFRGVFYPQR